MIGLSDSTLDYSPTIRKTKQKARMLRIRQAHKQPENEP